MAASKEAREELFHTEPVLVVAREENKRLLDNMERVRQVAQHTTNLGAGRLAEATKVVAKELMKAKAFATSFGAGLAGVYVSHGLVSFSTEVQVKVYIGVTFPLHNVLISGERESIPRRRS